MISTFRKIIQKSRGEQMSPRTSLQTPMVVSCGESAKCKCEDLYTQYTAYTCNMWAMFIAHFQGFYRSRSCCHHCCPSGNRSGHLRSP